jgi:hypothetical protein
MALASKSKRKTISPAVFLAKDGCRGEFHEAMNPALWEVLCYLFVKTTYTPWERRLDTPFSDPN